MRSVYKRHQRKLHTGEQQRTFAFIQAARGKKGGQKRREKRADRDAAIVQAVQGWGVYASCRTGIWLNPSTVLRMLRREGVA